MATPSELAAARAGEAGFRSLVEPRLAQAYRTAFLIILDRELARDAVQEALLRAYRGLNRLRPDSSFAAWFNRLVVNEARRIARRHRRQLPVIDQPPDLAPAPDHAGSPEEQLLAEEDRALLWAALADLDELHRTVLILRYYQGLTEPEMSETLGIPAGTVKSRLHAARERLRARLAAPKQPVIPSPSGWLHFLPRR
ncbi:MAG TPA: RNA polymerase sigma factor [Symbiobacteriaceae bacterium]|nr:RNA polymerase sigma factor [Symbiobacteriaceae bacterium]